MTTPPQLPPLPFCANDACEFHDITLGRNQGDRLRFDDGSYIERVMTTGGLLFCATCARALDIAAAAIRNQPEVKP